MANFEANPNITQLWATWGRQLITDESGAVTGVFVEDIDGNITKINGKSVVLATGGYLANEAMAKHYFPEFSLFPNCVWYQMDAKYQILAEIMDYCEANSVTEYCDLMSWARTNHAKDWIPVLVDSAYSVNHFLMSLRHKVKA